MSSYIGTFFMWNHISARFIFTWPEKQYLSQCNLPGPCVLADGTYRYWTGKCYLSSRFHLKLMSRIYAQKYIRKFCTCFRRLAASQRPLSKGGKTVMFLANLLKRAQFSKHSVPFMQFSGPFVIVTQSSESAYCRLDLHHFQAGKLHITYTSRAT
jgi:hypothetical protein